MPNIRKLTILSMVIAPISPLLIVAHAPMPLTAVCALLLLACVGYVWTHVLLRTRTSALELLMVGGGLTIAVPIIGGVVMQGIGIRLDPISWSCLFAAVALVGDLVLLFRPSPGTEYIDHAYSYSRPELKLTRPDLRFTPQSRVGNGPHLDVQRRDSPKRNRFSMGQVIACGIAGCITVGAVWLAVTGADSQKYPAYTQLWLASTSSTSNMDYVGISNQDGKSETYQLVILQNNKVSASQILSLGPGQKWQRVVPVGEDTRANLYLLPNLKTPYRFVDAKSQR